MLRVTPICDVDPGVGDNIAPGMDPMVHAQHGSFIVELFLGRHCPTLVTKSNSAQLPGRAYEGLSRMRVEVN